MSYVAIGQEAITEVKLLAEMCNDNVKKFPMNHNRVDFRSQVIMGSTLSGKLYEILLRRNYRQDWKQLSKAYNLQNTTDEVLETLVERLEESIVIIHTRLEVASMSFSMMFDDMKKMRSYKVPRDLKDDLFIRFVRFQNHIEGVLNHMNLTEHNFAMVRAYVEKRRAKRMKLDKN